MKQLIRKISSITTWIYVLSVIMFDLPQAAGQKKDNESARKIIPVISSPKYTEFAPTISADGRTMIFESDRDKGGWKLYESRLDKQGRWSEPVPITAINDKLHFLAGPSLSYDGNILLFTGFIENVTTSEDIFYSLRIDDRNWSEPISIGPPINTEDYEGFPSISADGNSLYFIRLNQENPFDRKNKEACFKILVSIKQPDGSWGEPTLLSDVINKGCERDPKIMADNHTLIFSSIQPNGKGKYDLYQTKKISNQAWSEPVALDFINSEENDQSPCIAASGDIIFFYSKNDIYSVPIPQQYRQMINVTVQGVVKDLNTNKPLKATIIVRNNTTGETFTSESNVHDGQYSIVLGAGQEYEVKFISRSYVPELVKFDLRTQDKYAEINKDINLNDSYSIQVTIADKDIKNPINASITIKDVNGGIILSEDLVKEKYPFAIRLKAGNDYSCSVLSPSYHEQTLQLNFDSIKAQTEMSYQFLLEHIKVSVTTDVVNIVSKEKLKSKVYFSNEASGEVLIAEPGETVYLRKGDRYQVATSSDKGYMFASTSIVAGETETNTEQKVSLQIIPIETGAQLTLNHISFSSNSAEIDSSSLSTLNRIIELLQKNPQISIEIAAHTDDIGDEVYNKRLSERRALAIVQYLSKRVIAIGRMRPIGYGKQMPLVPNDSEEHRALNRRVELKVLRAK
jgi:outer membrane protein OmpA-like peptidoglycan-associated protein